MAFRILGVVTLLAVLATISAAANTENSQVEETLSDTSRWYRHRRCYYKKYVVYKYRCKNIKKCSGHHGHGHHGHHRHHGHKHHYKYRLSHPQETGPSSEIAALEESVKSWRGRGHGRHHHCWWVKKCHKYPVYKHKYICHHGHHSHHGHRHRGHGHHGHGHHGHGHHGHRGHGKRYYGGKRH